MNSNCGNSTAPPHEHELEHKLNHVVLFPFMSKGHTIPLLHLARLLLTRRLAAAVTVFTTPSNRPFVAASLSDVAPAASVLDLPFPENIHPDIPAGVESTDGIPSMSLFYPFAAATALMQPHFDAALRSLSPPPTFVVSDGFLWWTLDSAARLGVPRLAFFGMSAYANSLCISVAVDHPLLLHGPNHGGDDDEPFALARFPWIRLTRNDFDPVFRNPDPNGVVSEFNAKCMASMVNSFGTVFNSFYELEPVFVDFLNQTQTDKYWAWCVGPLCLAQKLSYGPDENKPEWIRWLDRKLEQGRPVLYVAFGTQAEVSEQQMREIERGLEESEVGFMWVVREKGYETSDGFEERVGDRGVVVREWVEQRRVLSHESVEGFLSHCGWNSVVESVCSGVPILAWPMMAEQPLNARMVVEEIRVGLRVETCDGSVRGFVRSGGLRKMVRELMEGEVGEEVRRNAREFAGLARGAVEEGGSSWRTLDDLIAKICRTKVCC